MASVLGGVLLCVCVAVGVVLTSGCTQGCTDVGCYDGVGLDAPEFRAERDEWLTMRACVEGKCAEERGEISSFGVGVDVPEDRDEVSVTFTVRDADGRVLLDAAGTGRVRLNRPNGEGCAPVCRFVSVRVAGGRLVPVGS